mgnify:CR=1 FL=1|jgi:hypothetical protein
MEAISQHNSARKSLLSQAYLLKKEKKKQKTKVDQILPKEEAEGMPEASGGLGFGFDDEMQYNGDCDIDSTDSTKCSVTECIKD